MFELDLGLHGGMMVVDEIERVCILIPIRSKCVGESVRGECAMPWSLGFSYRRTR